MGAPAILHRAAEEVRPENVPTRQRSRDDAISLGLAYLLVTSASAILALVDPRLRHWFLLPVSACGVLVGIDAIDWLRRRRDIFDPQAVLGLFGVHFFYLAPILNVMLDHWPRYVIGPGDWREALGTMGMLNVVGLCVYRLILLAPDRRRVARRARQLNLAAFYRLGLFAAGVSILAFCGEVALFGGLSGYLNAMTGAVDRSRLNGLGWLLVLAETFPMLVFALVVVRWRTALARRPAVIVVLLIGLAGTQFFVAGLRGSRSNTIWPVLIALTLVHLLVVRISRKQLCVFVMIVSVFMYVYGLYKSAGLEVLEAARGTRSVEELSAETGRDVPALLLGDLSRADIQALLLDRQLRGDAELAYGVSYVGDVSFLVPNSILPERPRDKVAVGTDVLFGPGAFESGIRSSRVYGLAGEAVMNFGPLGGVASFAVLGLVVVFSRRYYARARQEAALGPKLLAPMLWAGAFLPTADLDNNLWFLIKLVLPLAGVVWLASRIGPTRPAPATGRHRAPAP
ncbi:hypothetical protein [Micromonospora sp. HM5-17]|jgi:hypothetical protein|uniref:hypothetical protein n=1 Tax=Micromonospora sp. HM5-17 TaxID=2487710 RepID=UPI000F4668AC|nr:hypothetical protein [Micromonospora sp. HM5-17]ROT33180.1 hypothetical protein EF879_08685 [Micromonospora sp. HM5-17]